MSMRTLDDPGPWEPPRERTGLSVGHGREPGVIGDGAGSHRPSLSRSPAKGLLKCSSARPWEGLSSSVAWARSPSTHTHACTVKSACDVFAKFREARVTG